jgi:uncharacterized protein with PIN domain
MERRYPFHDTFDKKCPKCGGGVTFNIKEKPNFRNEDDWTGYCKHCGKHYLFDECESFNPMDD